VLAGGKSTRFGSNKTIANIDGMPMARLVANNILSATQVQPRFLGADQSTALLLGLVNVSGPREGNGPLGAIIDALELSKSEIVLFAPNDTPYFTSIDFERLVQVLDNSGTDLAVAIDELDAANFHWLLSAWRTSTCLQHLSEQYANGVRSVHGAVIGLRVSTLSCASDALRNINHVSDMIDEGTV